MKTNIGSFWCYANTLDEFDALCDAVKESDWCDIDEVEESCLGINTYITDGTKIDFNRLYERATEIFNEKYNVTYMYNIHRVETRGDKIVLVDTIPCTDNAKLAWDVFREMYRHFMVENKNFHDYYKIVKDTYKSIGEYFQGADPTDLVIVGESYSQNKKYSTLRISVSRDRVVTEDNTNLQGVLAKQIIF